MADFRRWITVLVVLAACAGLANAQVLGSSGSSSTMICNASAGVTPQLRSEGYTELAGDIVIYCTGGQVVGPSTTTALPQTNIVVSLNTQVTSRLLSTTTTTVGYPSEALLMIDEPTTALNGIATGFGPTAPLTPCTTYATGCVAYPTAVTGLVGTTPTNVVVATAAASGNTTAANVYQGVVNGNQITFYGVPVLPPATSGYQRVYRITNVRANAQYLGPAASNGVSSLTASISTNGASSLPLVTSTVTIGYVQTGLSASAGSATTFPQCTSVTKSLANVLTFKELFGTAFKTRVAPLANSVNAGQAQNLTGQNTPGNFTYSESGFIYSAFAGTSTYAGLSDYGTRLKAVFNNIPSGVTIYVTDTNISVGTAPSVIGGTSTNAFAQLVASETTVDGSSFSTISNGTTTPALYALTASGGSATAVWEVVNAAQNQIDTLYFGVYVSFTANPGANIPASPFTGTVNLSYAPTWGASGSPFSASAAAAASASLPIPRFNDTSTALTVLKTNICQTAILWPYATNYPGFDTGLAISNTSSDPFGTVAQSGTCTLYFYGQNTSTGAGIVGTTYLFPQAFAPGTQYQTQATNLQTVQPGFQGYVIGVCNFQYAHGYAAVTDTGTRNFLGSYLALLLSDASISNTNGRYQAAERLEN